MVFLRWRDFSVQSTEKLFQWCYNSIITLYYLGERIAADACHAFCIESTRVERESDALSSAVCSFSTYLLSSSHRRMLSPIAIILVKLRTHIVLLYKVWKTVIKQRRILCAVDGEDEAFRLRYKLLSTYTPTKASTRQSAAQGKACNDA